ncbi:MAG TPA: GNAT family N-acetyltransferase [Dermatophilaceae bacterium]|jgi:phosphinothricin acetyltransferase|nr:GNAT family N-acetyltransferase [Dermatophilaceae bacterium]
MSQPVVRPAGPADLPAVAAIYAHFVRTSAATFDIEEPAMSYWQAKLDSTAVGDHFLVACDDDEALAFAYSASFRPRPAYDRTRETSVYVAPAATGNGLGTRLYLELLDLLRQDEVHLVVAVVTKPNPASNALHRTLGFTEVGTLDEVGFKFGAYLSSTWFQLRLS